MATHDRLSLSWIEYLYLEINFHKNEDLTDILNHIACETLSILTSLVFVKGGTSWLCCRLTMLRVELVARAYTGFTFLSTVAFLSSKNFHDAARIAFYVPAASLRLYSLCERLGSWMYFLCLVSLTSVVSFFWFISLSRILCLCLMRFWRRWRLYLNCPRALFDFLGAVVGCFAFMRTLKTVMYLLEFDTNSFSNSFKVCPMRWYIYSVSKQGTFRFFTTRVAFVDL